MIKYDEAFTQFTVTATGVMGGVRKGVFEALYSQLSATERPAWLANWEALDGLVDTRIGVKYMGPMYDVAKDTVERLQPSATPAQKEGYIRNALASGIWYRLKDKWARDLEIWEYDFNPGHNYDMEETETPDISRKHKVSADFEAKNEQTVKSKSTAGVYGFNSATSVPQSDSSALEADNKVTNTATQAGYTEDTESGTRKLERSGNIGVTTTTQMLGEAANFWKNFNFFDSIINDISSDLTLQVWEQYI